MNIKQKIRFALVALVAFLPLALTSGVARAQQGVSLPAMGSNINGFDVEQVKKLTSGTELDFTLYGTPGGTAIVSVEGATGRIVLEEVEAGVYEGTYSIKKKDRIVPTATVTANLRVGNQVASTILDESLVAGARSRSQRASDAAAASKGPRIDRFDVEPAHQLSAGNDLMFTVTGSPAGRASVRIAGVKGKYFLDETTSGVYQGVYTIKSRDRVAANAKVTANLRQGNREVNSVLGKSLASVSAPDSRARRVARSCPTCGTVEAINLVEVKGEGTYMGMIAGGVAGALLGSQIGDGRTTTVAEIAGAAGGAYAGNEVEKRLRKTKHYEVVVRLQGGGSQVVSFPAQPAFKVGDKVRVEAGALVLDR